MKIVDQGNPEEIHELHTAMAVGEALEKAYPNHPWLVCFQGGALMIRHLPIADEWKNATGKDGMCFLLPKDKLGTPKEIVKSAIKAGGQMLEAFGLKRGPWQGERPTAPRHMVLSAIKSNSKELN